MKDLPSLLPDDPAMAAIIAEAMAKEFSIKLENTEQVPSGHANSGQFTGKTNQPEPVSDKAKAKALKRKRQAENKANGVARMSVVENGGSCREFMVSEKLGRIAFYQENYLHIANNADENHAIMLKDDNIPNTLAYGKYYKDTYQGVSGWAVVSGNKFVFLSKDGDGVKIDSAYMSNTKAAVFKGRVALENEEEVHAP